ncbi:MAG: aminotransferase class V-fold PLP-dependent enzyme, partial [Clostridia bacterium]
MIYLDHAATTGQKPEAVLQAITESMNASVNAGRGSYAAARKAMQVIDDCRQNLLDLAQIASGYHVFFAAS